MSLYIEYQNPACGRAIAGKPFFVEFEQQLSLWNDELPASHPVNTHAYASFAALSAFDCFR
jgi:hypothetical protein